MPTIIVKPEESRMVTPARVSWNSKTGQGLSFPLAWSFLISGVVSEPDPSTVWKRTSAWPVFRMSAIV